MATWTAPTTRTTGALISASIWNTDIVENLKYLKDSPVFDGDISVGDDLLLTSTGAVINFASGDVTITHSTNTLTWAGASSGYIFNDGNLGLGVTPKTFTSGRAVEVGAAGNILWGNGGGDLFVASNLYYNADFKYAATNAIAAMRLQDGVVKFLTAPSGTADTTATMTERFRVLNGGNVAIGATARFYLDGVAGTGDTYIYEISANNMALVTGGTTGLQIDSAQNVIMKALGKLYLDGGFDTYIYEANANEMRLVVGGNAHTQFDGTGQYVYYNPPTTASAANAYITQSDYIRKSTSSIRYKHDIATLDTDDALSAVMAMRPVTYRGKTDDDQRRFVGFIAEEMQEIAPLLCTYDDGGESGTPNYVTYDRVTAYLVAVVQQQQTEINALKARIH